MSDGKEQSGFMQNRRHFSRVRFRHEITFQAKDGTRYPGAFDDISLKGMLFHSEPLPSKGTVVRGFFDIGEIRLELTGKVINVSRERGAAVRFQDLDVESFSHLRRLVALNMGDSELIDQEFFSSL